MFNGELEAEATEPCAEGHAGLLVKEALECAEAGLGCRGGFFERGERVVAQGCGHAEGAWIVGHRELEWNRGEGAHLIEDHRSQTAVGGLAAEECAEFDAGEDEFAKERGDVDGARGAGEVANRAGTEVEGAHRGGVGDVDCVVDAVGDPKGAVGRKSPKAFVDLDGEDAFG